MNQPLGANHGLNRWGGSLVCTGSQHLYGPETLEQVAANSRQIAQGLKRGRMPVRVVFKPVLTTPDAISRLCREANGAPECVGLICWMHTFSPAKMWIAGLTGLASPSPICTPNTIAKSPGARSTWTS